MLLFHAPEKFDSEDTLINTKFGMIILDTSTLYVPLKVVEVEKFETPDKLPEACAYSQHRFSLGNK